MGVGVHAPRAAAIRVGRSRVVGTRDGERHEQSHEDQGQTNRDGPVSVSLEEISHAASATQDWTGSNAVF